ncbi:glycosyltransferase family 2 protein [Microbacterium sp. SA39]|uniref:glycosyltransferase family 2 protein n=1 Tax=Microbacterium sp. SA39 TaxID=1263625 RepID=UPI0005F9DA34|nr:glycosyltransferase family 2 protein [Microbacterium sp. SA39]KJQ54588.1 putative glycosyltransferase EpsH [Microbacterium sp. SA39]
MPRPTEAGPSPTVSVVIPVKDDAEELRRCLTALDRQTRRPDEVIVVDNGSTDESAAVAADLGTVVVTCDQPGVPAASARGYDAAGGDLILRLDADCVPAETWVATVVEAFAQHPRVSAYTGGARFIDGPRELRTPLAAVYLISYTLATAPALGHLPLFGSNLAFRRSAWLSVRADVRRDDPERHDDLDLAFHLGERHRIRFLPQAEMGMSMRPFRSGRAFARRFVRGIRTVVGHWPEDFPPVRWVRLALRRVLHRLGVPTPARAAR